MACLPLLKFRPTYPMFRRSILLPLAFSLVLPAPLWSQAQGSGPSMNGSGGLSSATQTLKDELLTLTEGCDYAKYLDTAQKFQQGWSLIKNLDNFSPERKGLLAMTDLFAAISQEASRKAAEDGAKTQTKTLLFHLEQACQVKKNFEQSERMRTIMEDGQFNISKAFSFLQKEMTFSLDSLSNTKLMDEATFEDRYEKVYTAPGNTADSLMYDEVNKTLKGALKTSRDLVVMLDKVEKELKYLKKELILLAVPRDSTHSIGDAFAAEGSGKRPSEAWKCPQTYEEQQGGPGFLDSAPRDDNSEKLFGLPSTRRPICGPAPAEKSMQVLANIEILKAELMAIKQVSDARLLEVTGVRIMANTYQNKKKESMNRSLMHF